MNTRRQFFRTLFRSAATAAALAYAPATLLSPRWVRPQAVWMRYPVEVEIMGAGRYRFHRTGGKPFDLTAR